MAQNLRIASSISAFMYFFHFQSLLTYLNFLSVSHFRPVFCVYMRSASSSRPALKFLISFFLFDNFPTI